MLFEIHESIVQPSSSIFLRAGRNSIDDVYSCSTPVLLKFEDFKCSIGSKISGKFRVSST
ncbi:hypothetical protein C1H46_000488 [Malus baccata]|uniref:Uncharacterized protein n=1 Tax=Malus baccata TaxID=106549 RepID=A0A540NS53_MALBA|nr:hypothetical protein C1H46_000488 [Malus baccata]